MKHKMRRFKQQLSEQETISILQKATAGTLALIDKDNEPYSVPVSFVYHEGKIIFHGAKSGHKIDCIQANAKASFSVIDQDEVISEKYTTYFRSAICFGKIYIEEDDQKKYEYIDILAKKYRPGYDEERKQEIEKEWKALCVVVIEIERMTGKEAIELVRSKA